MNVLHVPYGFYPDPVGGTEVYVESLARALGRHGVWSTVAAPGPHPASYDHAGIAVHRFPVNSKVADLAELYGAGDPMASRSFGEILDQQRPDLVHVHALTRGVSRLTVLEARRRNVPVVFTYHTPTVSCQRGTLLRWGTDVCDGVLDTRRCAACVLQERGVPRGVAALASRVPPAAGRLAASAGLNGGFWTALRSTELLERRHDSLRSLLADVQRIVVVCQWAEDLLVRNGIPRERVTLCRHGLSTGAASVEAARLGERDVQGGHDTSRARSPAAAPAGKPATRTTRLAYFGRMDPIKGCEVLLKGLLAIPDARLSLDVYGVTQSQQDRSYRRALEQRSSGDPRVRFREPVPAGAVISQLAGYDALVVPSQCLETGPLVVLEAFAAGKPVIGSDLGGISELITPGVDGLLVPPNSSDAWAQMLRTVAESPRLLTQLGAGIRPPRTMETVAGEMAPLYAQVVRDAARPV